MRGNDFLECSSNFVPAAMRRLYLTFSNLYPRLLLPLLQLLSPVLLLRCCSCGFPGQVPYLTGTDAAFSGIGLFLWRCCNLCISPYLPGVGCSLEALWWLQREVLRVSSWQLWPDVVTHGNWCPTLTEWSPRENYTTFSWGLPEGCYLLGLAGNFLAKWVFLWKVSVPQN